MANAIMRIKNCNEGALREAPSFFNGEQKSNVDLKADFNKDDKVDTADLITFSEHWLSEAPEDLCNLDCIGIVEFCDLASFAEKWMYQ